MTLQSHANCYDPTPTVLHPPIIKDSRLCCMYWLCYHQLRGSYTTITHSFLYQASKLAFHRFYRPLMQMFFMQRILIGVACKQLHSLQQRIPVKLALQANDIVSPVLLLSLV